MAGLSSTREENFTSKDIFRAVTVICTADPCTNGIIDSKNVLIADRRNICISKNISVAEVENI